MERYGELEVGDGVTGMSDGDCWVHDDLRVLW